MFECFVVLLHLQVKKMSRILRIIQIIVNFFVWFYSFRLYFIRNNVVLKAYNFLQGPDVREII
jgi:hypothetical protein